MLIGNDVRDGKKKSSMKKYCLEFQVTIPILADFAVSNVSLADSNLTGFSLYGRACQNKTCRTWS